MVFSSSKKGACFSFQQLRSGPQSQQMITPIEEMRHELELLKAAKRKLISIEKLIKFCEILEACPSHEKANAITDAHNKHLYEHEMQLWRADVESCMQGGRFAYDTSAQCLKSMLIVAGGGAAALLTFLSGKAWDLDNRFLLVDAMGCFAGAIFLATLVHGLTYLTTLCYYEWDKEKLGDKIRWFSITCGVLAYIAVGSGFFSAYKALHYKAASSPASTTTAAPTPATSSAR